MEHIPCKPKGSGLYEQNLISKWRCVKEDVKPESRAENNPLVKVVLSIHLWKKKAFCTPPDSQPHAPGHLNTRTHTHTHLSRNALLESDIRALMSAHHPLLSFLYPCVMETVRCVCVLCSVEMCVCIPIAGSVKVCLCHFTCLCAFVVQLCVCLSLTQQILCSILVVVCVIWEMIDLGTHTSLQAWKKTERERVKKAVEKK